MMTEDETYSYDTTEADLTKNIMIPVMMLVVIIGFCIRAYSGDNLWNTFITMSPMILFVAAIFWYQRIWYQKVAKSATLKADALVLDKREIPYRNLVSVKRFYTDWSPINGKYSPFYVKDKDRAQLLDLRKPDIFMKNLAERMENSGMRIQRKTWGIGSIREIINLDRQKK